MESHPLTPAARTHLRRLVRMLAPHAARVDRRFQALLRRRRFDAAASKALLAITPAAAARARSLPVFLEQVEYFGRRLAKLNVPPGEVKDLLRESGALIQPVLEGRFEPAREQLQLATFLILDTAYYQVREEETQAFYGLYRAETEARDLEDLLRRFVRILARTFRARTGRLLLPGGTQNPELRRPLYIVRGSAEERLIADPKMRGRFASYWSYPLRSGGLMQFGFALPYPWLPREFALLGAAAERCHTAIERVRMEQEIRRLAVESRRAEEEERRRIGRELHDEAGQSMMWLRLHLEMLEREAPAALRSRLAEARVTTERTAVELRRIIAALSPTVLERLGLESALRQLAARFRSRHPAQLRLTLGKSRERLPIEIEEVIYRVTQECLQNISKHSQADHVNVLLRIADKNIRLSVSDNGAGFRVETAWKKPMSFGLAGMRERAALLGGSLTVRSAPGKGATVTLHLPRSPATVEINEQDSRTPN
ncbi:MAG TPA: sensor histidine kinase [Bryobacteraceae bacterium]|nr:sensor histidine kinase [Bryobacteraceae bacterium]